MSADRVAQRMALVECQLSARPDLEVPRRVRRVEDEEGALRSAEEVLRLPARLVQRQLQLAVRVQEPHGGDLGKAVVADRRQRCHRRLEEVAMALGHVERHVASIWRCAGDSGTRGYNRPFVGRRTSGGLVRRYRTYHDTHPSKEVEMSSSKIAGETSTATPRKGTVDLKFEVVVIPVSDVDRAKEFYGTLGWRLDADFPFDNGFRVVQFTPPGSGCSVQFGTNITSAAPGSAQGLYLIVSDVEAARDELAARGAEVSEVFHAGTPGAQFQPDGTSGRVSGPAPDHATLQLLRHVQRPGRQRLAACRRSRRGCPAGSTPPRRHSHPRPTWRARFGVRRPPTASTRSAPASETRTGPTGTPRTWWRSRRARNCRCERRPRSRRRRGGSGTTYHSRRRVPVAFRATC